MFNHRSFHPKCFFWRSFDFLVAGAQTMVHRARSFVHDLPARGFALIHRARGWLGAHEKRNHGDGS